MSDVSVIGLGSMGMALARALLKQGHRVTVWNRTGAKSASLVREGATLASNIVTAVEAGPVIIICVHDYKASYSLLDAHETGAALAGRVLVQLSTGTPQQAREHEAWAQARGVDYLDGAITATPSQINGPHAGIFVSGSASAYQKSEPLLKSLAGNVPYLGEQVGMASALDLAFLSYMFGSMLGFFHAARVLEAENLPVSSSGAMLAGVAPAIGEMMKASSAAIAANAYENPDSSLKLCADGVTLLVQQAQEAHINAEFPAFALGLFQKAVAMGYGNEKAAALIKVLRDDIA